MDRSYCFWMKLEPGRTAELWPKLEVIIRPGNTMHIVGFAQFSFQLQRFMISLHDCHGRYLAGKSVIVVTTSQVSQCYRRPILLLSALNLIKLNEQSLKAVVSYADQQKCLQYDLTIHFLDQCVVINSL